MKPKENLVELQGVLDAATETLKKITAKKMFGCHALWANENVFALVWKHGRIGVKLPDEKSYQELMKVSGAEPWKAGAMTMSHWVLVPESFHGKKADLKKWAAIAHQQCSALEKPKSKSAPKKSKPAQIKKR